MVYRVFRRPSIDLDSAPKTWDFRFPKDLVVGAIVAQEGQIVDIYSSERNLDYQVKFAGGATRYYPGYEKVYSFQ